MLKTKRLFLMPATSKMLDAAADQNWDALSDLLGGVNVDPNWTQFPESFAYVREHLQQHPDEKNWWNYFIVAGRDARLAGNCGYKGKPTPEGTVEIGYEITERYQKQGMGTEVVEVLLRHAFKFAEVKAVLAHTLPEENASTQILRKNGFSLVGVVQDDTDGTIWRWQKKK